MADSDIKTPSPHDNDTTAPEQETPRQQPPRRHWIKPTWLRRTLKTLVWVVVALLLLPVLVYLPPVQDLAVRIAGDALRKSTGMDVEIGKFRLKFPLDVSLRDVCVVEASGDTMVRASEVLADVKLLPLLRLDVDLNRVVLRDGYYRMVSPDSSMMLSVNAGYLEIDDSSHVDIRTMDIDLNRTTLRDGKLSLVMDVWKKKQEPADTAKSTPIKIRARNLDIENFGFAMAMLPTIDTMDVAVKRVEIRDALVDLGANLVKWRRASIRGGHFTYLAPTPEYVRTHPAPPSEPSSGPPMRIMGDSIAVDSLRAHYGIAGARPQPGFDANYLEVSGVEIGLRDFYNESSTVRLPLTRLKARERCGLQIVSGRGTVGIDSLGLTIDRLEVATLFSSVNATADVPFALMALEPSAPLEAKASGRIGLPDVEAFMPSLSPLLKNVPARKPLDFNIAAHGTLADVDIPALQLEMPGVLKLDARGAVQNPLDPKKLAGNLKYYVRLADPAVADKFIADAGFKLPAFTLEGTARAQGPAYGVDFTLRSDAGDVAAKGDVALTAETYNVDMTATGLDVGRFVPDLGIGRVSATVNAHGAGFDPLSGRALTDAIVNISSAEYNHRMLRDIRIDALLNADGDLTLDATSANPGLDFSLTGNGTIHTDDYRFDVLADMRDVNLRELGLADSICNGSGRIRISGAAMPSSWTYNVDLIADALEWNLPGQYIHLPEGIAASLNTNPVMSRLKVESLLTSLEFNSPVGPESLIRDFTRTADLLARQVADKNVVIDSITGTMPDFTLDLNAAGRGLLDQLLQPSGLAVDTLYARISKDSLLRGNIGIREINTGAVSVDTVTLDFLQRGSLIDYRAHVGNRPGTLDEFAKVNVNGYLGDNRMSAFLNQWNIRGEQGYRIGITAAYTDSVLTAHITPLKSTIAYMPWTFNADNFVDFNIHSKKVEANLTAHSAESSITAKTQALGGGREELYVNLTNIHIQDFLRMWAFAPPMQGDLNADLHVNYEGRRFTGKGGIGLKGFTYEKTRIGDFDLDLDAGYGFDSSTDVRAGLRINGDPAIALYANLVQDAKEGLRPDSVGLSLTRFPLKVANPFMGETMRLGGYLNGDMQMEGSFSKPVLNGQIAFDSVTAAIPMAGATLRFVDDRIMVADNVVKFDAFNIYGANSNPISLNGTVNARDLSAPVFNLKAEADNFQLIKSDRRSRAPLYGKIFLNLDATVTGPLHLMDVEGNVSVLGTTDATYQVDMNSMAAANQRNQDIVKFVNFNDTTQVAAADSVEVSPLNMRVNAALAIQPGAQFTVLLSDTGTDKVELSPTANLRYHQNYMGDMSLNGSITLGEGFGRYALPVIGEKMFVFNPQSTISWNGPVMNPSLNVTATDDVKANVRSGSSSRLVNFLVTLHAYSTLQNLQVNFDLSTNDDLAIQNELQSMSADQRQTQAMNLLLYGQYAGQNSQAKAASSNILYSYLESELNSMAAKYVRGVDLTFGVDQYDRVSNGVSNTETTYSYQVSKSLFNNRFKINVGGNYSTDTADDDIAENLVGDVSLEYMLKQTENMNMSVSIFRHIGYESILEGEITEMGVAYSYKRRLQSLRGLFRFSKRKKKGEGKGEKPDSTAAAPVAATPADTLKKDTPNPKQ